MLKIAKLLIIKSLIHKTKHISSRPLNHSKISVFLLGRYIISFDDIHYKPPRLIIYGIDITLSCNFNFCCHILFFSLFFILIVILKQKTLAIRILFIELVQVLRKLLTDIEQIVEVGDVLPA